MNAEDFPAAFWGKAARTGGVTPQSYELLARDPAFPDAALADLESLSRAFTWNSRTEDVLPACFAYWPTTGGALLARLLDAGPDDQNRPHCLRIEAAFATDQSGATAAWLSQWLHRDAWPIGMLNFRRATRLLLYQQPADGDLVRALEEHAGRPVLATSHGEFSASDRFARIIGAPGATPSGAAAPPVEPRQPTRPASVSEFVRSQPIAESRDVRRPVGVQAWITYALGAALVISILLLVASNRPESAAKKRQNEVDAAEVDGARLERNTNVEMNRLKQENERLKKAMRRILEEVKSATSDPS